MEKSFIAAILILTIIIVLQNVATVPVGTRILSQRSHFQDNGYQFQYEAEDGSRREENGTLVYKENKEEPILHVKGMYSYFNGDGRKYVVHYEADDRGYKTEGDMVPPLQNATTTTTEIPTTDVTT